WVKELDLTVRELMFIPEDRQSVCWRFVIDGDLTRRELRLLVDCEFNLMWEAKQAGEQYKTKKEILQYDEKDYLVLAKHYRYPDWTGIIGANRQPSSIRLGLEGKEASVLGDPDFGSVKLEYEMTVLAGEPNFDIDLCLAGGSLSYPEVIAEFHDCMVGFDDLAVQKTALYEEYLMNTLEVSLSDQSISRAFKWSKVNLRMLEHYQPGFGTGLFAGLPHFAIYFGRDIAWSTQGLLAIGDFESARENLNLLAKFQARANGEDMLREPFYLGEIPHEIRTEGTVYYYSVDATPLFVIACKSYLDWTRDTNFVRYLYDNIIRAVDWSLRADRDGDGLVEHGPEGFLIDTTWMDSYYRGKSAVDVQAICCRALFDGAQIAKRLGDDSRANHWLARAVKLKDLILQRYWDNKSGFFYDTIGVNGEPKASLTINSIVPVMLGLTDDEVTDHVMKRIESSEFTTDWGIRTMSRNDPEYDPRSYQKGGVWPFCTGWVARTEFIKRLYREGVGHVGSFVKGLDMGANYFKEVLYGDLPPTGKNPVQPTGCFIQAWSAGMFLSSIVEGLLGVDPGINQASNVRITPYLGEGNSRLDVSSIRVGQSLYDLKVTKEDSLIDLKLKNRGPGPQIVESGFVVSSGASSVVARADSGTTAEELSYQNERGYITCSFRMRLLEDESKEIQLKLR
ncbi:MAG: amylo-alpha-1,6-glucosidase, partial [Nitrososphaerales archaeon]